GYEKSELTANWRVRHFRPSNRDRLSLPNDEKLSASFDSSSGERIDRARIASTIRQGEATIGPTSFLAACGQPARASLFGLGPLSISGFPVRRSWMIGAPVLQSGCKP